RIPARGRRAARRRRGDGGPVRRRTSPAPDGGRGAARTEPARRARAADGPADGATRVLVGTDGTAHRATARATAPRARTDGPTPRRRRDASPRATPPCTRDHARAWGTRRASGARARAARGATGRRAPRGAAIA